MHGRADTRSCMRLGGGSWCRHVTQWRTCEPRCEAWDPQRRYGHVRHLSYQVCSTKLTTDCKKKESSGVETTHLYVCDYANAQGFYARPEKEADGSLNLLVWEVGIPGKANVRTKN